MITVKVFKDGSKWFGARWVDGEYDGCDPLDVDEGAPEVEALAAAQAEWGPKVSRVQDIDSEQS
jgi:hypothetical protein